MSKNAEGWVRHRGGKCPVEDGQLVDIRLRNGNVSKRSEPESLIWGGRVKCDSDIMAYKLHKPAERVAPAIPPEIRVTHIDHEAGIIHAESASSSCGNLKAEWHEVKQDSPLQWRDRITNIDFDIKDLTTERANLVQKLAREGFALIWRGQDAPIGLPRIKWEVGDLVMLKCKSSKTAMPIGWPLPITFFDGSSSGQGIEVDNIYFPLESELFWHSRPSA